MANENIKKLNGITITVGSKQRRFSTSTTDRNTESPITPDADVRPRPPTPDEDGVGVPGYGHNDDEHHHHGHNHGNCPDGYEFNEDLQLCVEEQDDVAPDPSDDLIDIVNFQSEFFYTNKITILEGLGIGNKVLQIKDIGINNQNTLDTIERMGELLQQFPTEGNNSILNLAINPYYRDLENQLTLIGVGPHDVPDRLTFIPENVIGNVDGDTLMSLPFPKYVEEFDVASPRIELNLSDSLVWGDVGRPDIAVFIQAYLFVQLGDDISSQEVLDGFYNDGGYKFSEVHPDLYNQHILSGEVLPSVNGTLSLLYLFSYYTNILETNYYFELIIPNEEGLEIGTFNIPRLKFKLVGPGVNYQDIEEFTLPEIIDPIYGCTDPTAANYDSDAEEDDGTCLYYGCTDPEADNYDPNANIPDNPSSCEYLGCTDSTADNFNPTANIDDGSCTYLELDYNEDGDGIDEEDPINNILTDNYSADEEISENFGVPGVTIEQTLYQPYDPFSGMDIDTNVFQNTLQSLIDSDSDGRIALGMFSFDDNDNILENNFPNTLREPFRQYNVSNLVPNPQGRFVKSIWQNKYGPDNTQRDEDDWTRERFFIPSNNWGYCTFDALADGDKKRSDDLYKGGDDRSDDTYWGSSIENITNGTDLINSFEQTPDEGLNDAGGTIDSQGVIGYAGYHAYFFDYQIGDGAANQSLLRLQHNLLTASLQTSNQFNQCNKFFMQNQIDSLGKQDGVTPPAVSNHASYINARKCTATGNQSSTSTNSLPYKDTWFPNVAKWIIDKDFLFDWEQEVQCYSFGRCLEFLGTNFKEGDFDFNDSGTDDVEGDFEWDSDTSMNIANGGVTQHQYRGLNQVIKIYNPYIQDEESTLNPFTIMEVKFKMKSLDLYSDTSPGLQGVMYDVNNPPQVEIAIVDGDGSTMSPLRTKNRDQGERNLPYAYQHGYWPHGDFNSQRYSDDLNTQNTLDRKYSNFGSMGRFQNTEPNKWETFSYKFTMGEVFQFGDGIVRPLWLLVQAAGEFYGRVLLDDFEVYESYDFIPDVDVRKKISVGNYGKADLTKYYDKELQPEEYKDSQGPLEAQFYFYPQHPSNEIFNQKRTPIYNDFKKGKFYIYNVDWGDGSSNEFVSKPEPFDENTALYHTYESSGLFEVTGTMIRMKENTKGKLVGIAKNKKFRLRININEGLDEDFQYFGSDGFSFIPYKNTLPIIGGYSEQSIYYKAIKRQLGFLNDNEKTSILFSSDGDKLKTQIALDKMDSSFTEDLDLLNEYKRKRYDVQPLISHNFENVNNLQWADYSSGTVEYENGYLKMTNDGTNHWLGMMENTFTVQYGKTYQIDAEIYVPLDWDGGYLLVGDGASFGYWEPDGNLQQIPETYNITTDLGIRDEFQPVRTTITIPEEDEFNYNNDLIGKYYVRVSGGNPSAGKFIYLDNFTIRQINLDNLDEVIYNGIETYPNELGKSIGDTDVTNIKFYNKSMNIADLLGFQCDEFSEVNTIKLNNPQNGVNYRHHSLADLDILPANEGITLPEGTEDIGTMTLIYDDFNSETDNNHMRVGYRFRVNNEDDIQYVDAGNSTLKVSTPYLKAGKTYTFSTHIYIPDGFYSQGEGNQIQLGVIQTPADNDWAANENFLDSAYCCTEEDFLNNLCMYDGEDRVNDDQISYGSSLQWSYYEGCYYNGGDENNALRESRGETPKGMTYTTLDTAPIDENNQWYRISATFTPLNPDEYGDYLSFRIIPYEIGRPLITDDIYYVVGAQLEEGDVMSPYRTDDVDVGDCLRFDANIPDNPRYWKNIIPENYSIYNRKGIDLELTPPIDTFVEQEWLDDSYYYPVLPNYDLDGQFIEGDLTNDKIPFSLEAAITDELESNENLLINIISDKVEGNVFNDTSGNENLGFGVVDYKPIFDNKTLKPKKRRNTDLVKTSTNNGAF